MTNVATLSQPALSDAEAEIDRELRNWKDRMRDERSRRLAQSAPSTHRGGSDSTAIGRPAPQTSVPHLRIDEMTRGGPKAAAKVVRPSAVQPSATAHTYRPPATIKEYKREVEELAKPLASIGAVGREPEWEAQRPQRSASQTKKRNTLTSGQRTLRPSRNDVTYFTARSVLGDYIHRPPMSARDAGPDESASPARHRGERGRFRHNEDNHGGSRPVKSSHTLSARAKSAFAAPPLSSSRAEPTDHVHRAALHWQEAARRSETGRQQRQLYPRERQDAATHPRAGAQAPAAWQEWGSSGDGPSVTAAVWMTSPRRAPAVAAEGPARTLFAFTAPSTKAVATTMTSSGSRFKPTIQYRDESLSRAQPRAALQHSQIAASHSLLLGESTMGSATRSRWRDAWREETHMQAEVSVSPSTPSPPATSDRSRAADFPAAAAADVRSERWNARGVQRAALGRTDLFQGTESLRNRELRSGYAWKDDLSPEPRTVQPHPRPVWY